MRVVAAIVFNVHVLACLRVCDRSCDYVSACVHVCLRVCVNVCPVCMRIGMLVVDEKRGPLYV